MLTAPAHHGDFLAVCDVDRKHAEKAKNDQRIGKEKAEVYEDYRKLLDRKDIDAVIIGTPDHWHTKICIDAMHAGKDIYCEKPLTLTIDEGKKLGQVAKETNRVVQVGTQQRSDHNRVFLLAVAMVRDGPDRQDQKGHRVDRRRADRRAVPRDRSPRRAELGHVAGPGPQGRLPRASLPRTISAGGMNTPAASSPTGAPTTSTSASGPSAWRIPGPNTIEVVKGVLPVEFKAGYPTVDDRYNTATEFLIRATFANGVVMDIRHDRENGVKFEGVRRQDLRHSRPDRPRRRRGRRALQEPGARVASEGAAQGQAGRWPHGEFLRMPPRPLGARFRRLVAPPGAHDLPPGEYRDAAGPSEAHLGPRQGRDRRRLRGQRPAIATSACTVRDRLIRPRAGGSVGATHRKCRQAGGLQSRHRRDAKYRRRPRAGERSPASGSFHQPMRFISRARLGFHDLPAEHPPAHCFKITRRTHRMLFA